MKQSSIKRNENSRSDMNITGDESVSSKAVGSKTEIIKTSLENINCLKKQFSQNQNSAYNSCQKSLKWQNQNIDSQADSSFVTRTKKSKSDKSNEIDNNINLATHKDTHTI